MQENPSATTPEPSPEITGRERALYKIKDALGEVGAHIISYLMRQIYPTITAWTGGIHWGDETESIPEINISDFSDLISKLTPAQIEFLERIITQLNHDQKILEQRINSVVHEELRDNAYLTLLATYQPSGAEAKEGLVIRNLPGALAVIVKDENLFSKMFPDRAKNFGFYYRPRPSNNSNWLNGRVLTINQEKASLESTLSHEYLHFLTAMYLEPNELPIYVEKKTREQLDELEKNNTRIFKLKSETTTESNTSEMLELEERNQAIQIDLAKEIDFSDQYLSPQARDLFKKVRNELSAYTLSGTIQTLEFKLISSKSDWEKLVAEITHISDKKKIGEGWIKLKLLLEDCNNKKIEPETLFPIFITSQSFAEMYKRISLLLEEMKKKSLLEPKID